jgi:diacylglycerol kinase family enzyme
VLGIKELPVADLISSWEDPDRQPFDVGVAHGAGGPFRFLESTGVGLLAQCIATADDEDGEHAAAIDEEEDPARRIAAARGICADVLDRIAPARVTISVDGRDVSGSYLLVEAMNCGAAGPGLTLTPAASPHDGLLDLVVLGDDHRRDLRSQLRGNEPSGGRVIGVHQGRHIRIECAGCLMHVDDELWSDREPKEGAVELTVEPGALTMLLPRGGRTRLPVTT